MEISPQVSEFPDLCFRLWPMYRTTAPLVRQRGLPSECRITEMSDHYIHVGAAKMTVLRHFPMDLHQAIIKCRAMRIPG